MFLLFLGIAECEERKAEVESSCNILEEIETPENMAEILNNKQKVFTELELLKQNANKTEKILNANIELWKQYDINSEGLAAWLKDTESKVKSESSNQTDLTNINDKLNEIVLLKTEVDAKKPLFYELDVQSKNLIEKNPEARVAQFVGHLTTRYENSAKILSTLLERLNAIKHNNEIYDELVENCKEWLTEAKNEQNQFARFGSPGASPSTAHLDDIQTFVTNLESKQDIINQAVDVGESLYPGILPENREKIRAELRSIRDQYNDLFDDSNSLLKHVETVLIQKTSIEESYAQVKQWLNESKSKVGETIELYPTLAEKKAALHNFKTQLQEISLHKNALKKLQEKATALADDDSAERVDHSIQEHESLSGNLKERISNCENYVINHETYDQILEKASDWLAALKAEAIDLLNETTFEKEGAEEKLIVVENLIMQRPEGDKIFTACNSQLQTVLIQTHPSGHPALLKSFKDQKVAWDSFIQVCESSQSKLKQLCSKWNEFDSIIEELDSWMKQKENIVKDQSLKSTLEKKELHLNKLKELDNEINIKAPEIARIVEQGHEIEGETDLNLRVSRLNTRYQTLKNLCKEAITRYVVYTKEHKTFNDDYEIFKKALEDEVKILKENAEVVGDYAILQERQNKIREMADKRINESSIFEGLIDRGEKLYAHTSPDGREIIRQQLRSLRNMWDNFTEDLNSATQALDQCLLQFGDFTSAQEQLTKWLVDVEKSMQSHTELSATLQEKRAHLQNHKLIHQEINSHNVLVDSVCDKAQQLIDQTKAVSLNVYLQSIKQLFQDITSKSQDLLNNLDGCAQAHNNLNNLMTNIRNWTNGEMEKLIECDDTTGEKADINRRLGSLDQLKKNELNGQKLLDELLENFAIVSKSTAPKGVEILQKEIDEIQNQFKNHFNEIGAVEDKQKAALKQWQEYEKSLDELTKWCRATESIFREQPLQSSMEEKEQQLNKYKEQREIILGKEKVIDSFVDKANNLLNNSGAERLKNLISQLSNRSQLLQVLSKEVVNRWQGFVDDHRKYEDKQKEVLSWITPIEAQLESALKEEATTNVSNMNLLQLLLTEREQAENMISSLTTLGEKVIPETSTQGREKIRQDLRDIRDRWDKLDDGIRNLQKRQEAQTMQWSSYQDTLQQTLSWLEGMEKNLQQESPNTWTSTQEIRSKLFKHKASLQEIASHKRIIEAVTEKANGVLSTGVISNPDEVQATINDLNERYDKVQENCTGIISQLDEALDAYQQFNDLQKAQQDYQKNLWDRLTGYSDYSGNKAALQSRYGKISEIQDALPEGTLKLQILAEHINKVATKVPNRSKEAMDRDLAHLNLDFDKFSNALSDVKSGLENRLQQWNDYENNLDRLINWLSDAENSLKNYSPKSTMEEKEEQLKKFQALLQNLKQNENEFDKMTDESSELIQSSGETRLSVNVQQITSRFQSIQATAKEVFKKCEQAVNDHQGYNDKYKQCSDWIAAAQVKYEQCSDVSNVGSRPELIEKYHAIQELVSQQGSATQLLNNTVDLGEKLYPSTAVEGREAVRLQVSLIFVFFY